MSRLSNVSRFSALVCAATAAVMQMSSSPPNHLPMTLNANSTTNARTTPTGAPGTINASVNVWYDTLVDYAKPYFSGTDVARPIDTLRNLVKVKGNKANTTALRIFMVTSDLPDDMRNAIQATLDAVNNRQFKDEFKRTYSDSHAQVSAASTVFHDITRAIETAKSEADVDAGLRSA